MKEPRWLIIDEILAFHAKQIREHGGSHGIRDRTLLESAIARPRHLFSYAVAENNDVDLFSLAAAYTYGISRNHPFVDGNKRTAITSGGVFLILNKYTLQATEPEVVSYITQLAAGKLDEQNIGEWLRQNSVKISSGASTKHH